MLQFIPKMFTVFQYVVTLCIKILLSTNYTPLILQLVNLKNTDEIVQYNFNCNIFI